MTFIERELRGDPNKDLVAIKTRLHILKVMPWLTQLNEKLLKQCH